LPNELTPEGIAQTIYGAFE